MATYEIRLCVSCGETTGRVGELLCARCKALRESEMEESKRDEEALEEERKEIEDIIAKEDLERMKEKMEERNGG